MPEHQFRRGREAAVHLYPLQREVPGARAREAAGRGREPYGQAGRRSLPCHGPDRRRDARCRSATGGRGIRRTGKPDRVAEVAQEILSLADTIASPYQRRWVTYATAGALLAAGDIDAVLDLEAGLPEDGGATMSSPASWKSSWPPEIWPRQSRSPTGRETSTPSATSRRAPQPRGTSPVPPRCWGRSATLSCVRRPLRPVQDQHGVLAEPLALLEGERGPEVVDDAVNTDLDTQTNERLSAVWPEAGGQGDADHEPRPASRGSWPVIRGLRPGCAPRTCAGVHCRASTRARTSKWSGAS